jgi:hypothetical protein
LLGSSHNKLKAREESYLAFPKWKAVETSDVLAKAVGSGNHPNQLKQEFFPHLFNELKIFQLNDLNNQMNH